MGREGLPLTGNNFEQSVNKKDIQSYKATPSTPGCVYSTRNVKESKDKILLPFLASKPPSTSRAFRFEQCEQVDVLAAETTCSTSKAQCIVLPAPPRYGCSMTDSDSHCSVRRNATWSVRKHISVNNLRAVVCTSVFVARRLGVYRSRLGRHADRLLPVRE